MSGRPNDRAFARPNAWGAILARPESSLARPKHKTTTEPARIMTVDGVSSLGHARHGIIGILVTATGRYRVELWTRPGSELDDVKLFNTLLSTFAIT